MNQNPSVLAVSCLVLSALGCGRTVVRPADAADVAVDAVLDASDEHPLASRTMALAGQTSCRIADGRVVCWGANVNGMLGIPREELSGGIRSIPLRDEVIQVAVTLGGVSAVTRGHELWWWGRVPEVPVVNGADLSRPRAVTIPRVRAVVASGQTCALLESGEVWCGGFGAGVDQPNERWNTVLDRLTPIEGVHGAIQVAAGGNFALALMEDGSVWCWGNTQRGQCGPDGATPTTRPVRVRGLPPVARVGASDGSACAITRDHALWCWGMNTDGQLGDGTRVDRATPSPVAGMSGVVDVSLYTVAQCALRADGSVWCWGRRDTGLLGDGIRAGDPGLTPIRVPGVADAVELAVGIYYACVRRRDDSLLCWGATAQGRLAGASGEDHTTPVAVTLTP